MSRVVRCCAVAETAQSTSADVIAKSARMNLSPKRWSFCKAPRSYSIYDGLPRPKLQPRVPLVAAVRPTATLAATEHVEPVHGLDAGHEFRVLVADLPFHP